MRLFRPGINICPITCGQLWVQVSRTHWSPIAQTTFRGCLGRIWPQSLSSVYAMCPGPHHRNAFLTDILCTQNSCLISIWFTVMQMTCLGSLACQDKQQIFVNTLFQLISPFTEFFMIVKLPNFTKTVSAIWSFVDGEKVPRLPLKIEQF